MYLCQHTPSCDAVQVQDYSSETGPCWLRKEVDVQDCYYVDGWVIYTKPTNRLSIGYYINDNSHVHTAMSILIGVLIVLALCLCAFYVYKRVKRSKEMDNYALTGGLAGHQSNSLLTVRSAQPAHF